MEKFLEISKKYGATGVMAIGLVWFNQRLSVVESKLYDCYENQINKMSTNTNETKRLIFNQYLAILNSNKDENNRQNKGKNPEA